MRLLHRNCAVFEYIPYIGLESDVDENDLHTGIMIPKYGDPVKYVGSISTPSGSAIQAYSGLDIRYSHVLLMDDPKAEINEYGKVRYNNKTYTVTAVRPSLNVLSVALLEDTVNLGDQVIFEKPGE